MQTVKTIKTKLPMSNYTKMENVNTTTKTQTATKQTQNSYKEMQSDNNDVPKRKETVSL